MIDSWESTTNFADAYDRFLKNVLQFGHESAPRGMRIKEMNPLVVGLERPETCVVSRKGFSKPLMWLEIASVIGGEFDPALYEAVSPSAAGLMSPQGAYGPRTVEQLRYVVEELVRDPDSRRAVVYVGSDKDLRYSQHFEQPCTMTWQFLLRPTGPSPKLHMIVNMRSWDLVWGLGYDLPVFVSVQMALASALGVEVGKYTHIAGSGHIYERHWDVDALGINERDPERLVSVAPAIRQPTELDNWNKTVDEARLALRALKSIIRHNGSAPYTVSNAWKEAGEAWQKQFSKE